MGWGPFTLELVFVTLFLMFRIPHLNVLKSGILQEALLVIVYRCSLGADFFALNESPALSLESDLRRE
jgi:hypothetical protein